MTDRHILVGETPEANLSPGTRLLNGRYGQVFNGLRPRKGHLLEDGSESVLVEEEGYFPGPCRYLVLKPVRAGMRRAAREWRWSNDRATAGETARPGFLGIDWTLSQFGTPAGRARGV